MKFRTDFVTNSSSSSFIIATVNPEDIEVFALKALKSKPFKHPWEPDEDHTKAIEQALLLELKNSEITVEEYLEIITNNAISDALYKFSHNIPFSERKAYFESEEFKEKKKEHIDKFVKKALEKIEGKNHIYHPSFSDNDGVLYAHLEHEVAPCIEGVIYEFNNH